MTDDPKSILPTHSHTSLALPSPSTSSASSLSPSTISLLSHRLALLSPSSYPAVSPRRLELEALRPRWLRECTAEATGVFFFVFPGIASAAALVLHEADPSSSGDTAVFGSFFQVGWAFGVGVALAVITCAPVSGGHFNPAITLAMAVWRGFPWRKVPGYIASQVLGSFVAGLLLAGVYWDEMDELARRLTESDRGLVGPGTPASILCAFPQDGQRPLFLLTTEFFADLFIGVALWAILDPSNPFMRRTVVPWAVALTYACMVWGFGPVTLSTNLARDLGTRLVAAVFYGSEAITYKGYAPIGILVNVPATLLATVYYELVMRSSLRVMEGGHAGYGGDEGELRAYLVKISDEEAAAGK